MSFRRDAGLAGLVLIATAVAVFVVGASLSLRWAMAGAVATIGFETLAAGRSDAIRRRWERPGVQAGAVLVALIVVIAGAGFGPSVVLSAVLGALATYLLVLGCVVGYRRLENG